MEFSQWLAARGFVLDELTEAQEKALKALYDAEQADEVEATTPEPVVAEAPAAPDPKSELIAEAKRIAEIQAAAAGFPAIVAEALEKGWSTELVQAKVELQRERDSRPDAVQGTFSVHSTAQDTSVEALEAAVCLSLGMSPEELINPAEGLPRHVARGIVGNVRALAPKVVDAADKQYRNLGLKDLCWIAARRDRNYTGMLGDTESVVRAAFDTLTLPTVFQTALNRALLAQYKMAEFKWRDVVRTTSVPDFRSVTRFRVHGTGAWEKLTVGGELKTGQIEEGASYTIQAETIGQINFLTREDFINDDLGALSRIAEMMAFYGSLAPEIQTFKTISDNASNFFHANNSNLVTGTANAFGETGLKELWKKFRMQRDRGVSKDTVKPAIDIRPRILLVPVELEMDAMLLLGTNNFAVSGGSNVTKTVAANPFYNAFKLVASPYLSDTSVSSGASSTAFYLLADPAMLPAIEVCFLNGKQRPTVESCEPRPEVLGMGFRGWLDFGVKLMDPKAAAKATGVA